jgi:hypothetical protein
MHLQVEWARAVTLKDGAQQNFIYVTDLSKLPKVAGVYVFGRRWGKNVEALYVGQATSIRGRVKTQLNNLRLMQHLKNAKTGRRVVLTGRIDTRPGQKLAKCLALVERTLIRYFLSEGHDLVNKQGVRIRRHDVVSSGKYPKRFIPSPMYLERGKGE